MDDDISDTLADYTHVYDVCECGESCAGCEYTIMFDGVRDCLILLNGTPASFCPGVDGWLGTSTSPGLH